MTFWSVYIPAADDFRAQGRTLSVAAREAGALAMDGQYILRAYPDPPNDNGRDEWCCRFGDEWAAKTFANVHGGRVNGPLQ